MNKLEQAKSKLERIRKDQEDNALAIKKEHEEIPFGQPNIIGRRNIYKGVQKKYSKAKRLMAEEEKQKDRVEMLEEVEYFKSENDLLKDVHVVGNLC